MLQWAVLALSSNPEQFLSLLCHDVVFSEPRVFCGIFLSFGLFAPPDSFQKCCILPCVTSGALVAADVNLPHLVKVVSVFSPL